MTKHPELEFDPTKDVKGISVSLFPGQQWPLTASAYAIDKLTLQDGCLIYVMPGITQVQMTINELVLIGNSTFDLTSKGPSQSVPPKRPTHGQPPPEHHRGDDGETGTQGGKGDDGVTLQITVNHLDGSGGGTVWVRTDGREGGRGGDGGDGAKGSAGPDTCAHKGDGGDGGDGGRGGQGGNGGNTAKVLAKINGNSISPSAIPGLAPSSRPTIPAGGIVFAGAPGAGGPGGAGGQGGGGGEGYENHFPCPGSDSSPGHHGNPGGPGPQGTDGKAQ